METVAQLKEKIQALEQERSQLKSQIENLRKAVEMRATTLEEEINNMREELATLNQVLCSPEEKEQTQLSAPKPPSPEPTPQTVSEPSINVTVQTPIPETPTESTETQPVEQNYASLLETLNSDERRIVEILLSHEGKSLARQVRIEANLNWLQANRIISRLVNRGIITIERQGSKDTLIMTKKPI